MESGSSAREAGLTTLQEFSIEIPDKEADAIHSGRSIASNWSCQH